MSNSITAAGYLPGVSSENEKSSKRAELEAARARRKEARAEARKARAEHRKSRRRSDADEAVTTDELPDITYSIDELAAKTGVPSRTIRFYQAQKILDRPIRKGRVAVYTDAHAERLQLISTLQDRGLRIRGMKQLLSRSDADTAVREWLGLSEKLATPWTEEKPRVLDEAEMTAMLGDRPAGTLAALLRAGLVSRPDDAPHSYLVPSPTLLDVSLKLVGAGLSIELLSELEPILRDGLSKTARSVVDHFAANLDDDELSGAIDALRSVGNQAIGIMFAREVERTLSELLENGAPPAKKRTGRPRRKRR